MPITAYINRDLAIRVHRIRGRPTAQHFLRLMDYYRTRPHIAQTDVISLVDEDADPYLSADDLATLKTEVRALYAGLTLEIVRRSAWVCPNVRVWPVLENWLEGRHSLDGGAAEHCLVARLEDAAGMFDADELAAVRDWTGFSELHYFGGEACVI